MWLIMFPWAIYWWGNYRFVLMDFLRLLFFWIPEEGKRSKRNTMPNREQIFKWLKRKASRWKGQRDRRSCITPSPRLCPYGFPSMTCLNDQYNSRLITALVQISRREKCQEYQKFVVYDTATRVYRYLFLTALWLNQFWDGAKLNLS